MMNNKNPLFFQYFADQVSNQQHWSVIFEDDGKTAYAYLFKNNEIVGDVWLYNRGAAPAIPEWNDPENLPFANPDAYSRPLDRPPVKVQEDINCIWQFSDGELYEVLVHLRDEVFARLTINSKPGESILATKDGPLAKKLNLNTASGASAID